MTRTALTITTTAAAGVTLNAAQAVDNTNGNTFTNTGRELIEITNGSGSTLTVGFTTNGVYTVGLTQYAVADLNVSVLNATSKVCGPFDKTLFNDGSNNVDVDWSSGSSVTCRVISLGTA